jgi:hypothetical protein
MKFRDFLEQWGLTNLKIQLGFLEGSFAPRDADRSAAWDLYVELLTRVTTQHLPVDSGDEKSALNSIYQIFPLTREILKKHGSGSGEFAKIAIPVLNQVIRPFTAKWHKLILSGALEDASSHARFREDLSCLQIHLRQYTRALGAMAKVEDLTALEELN